MTYPDDLTPERTPRLYVELPLDDHPSLATTDLRMFTPRWMTIAVRTIPQAPAAPRVFAHYLTDVNGSSPSRSALGWDLDDVVTPEAEAQLPAWVRPAVEGALASEGGA